MTEIIKEITEIICFSVVTVGSGYSSLHCSIGSVLCNCLSVCLSFVISGLLCAVGLVA